MEGTRPLTIDVQALVGVPNLIADMNRQDLAFTVHDGDLKAGDALPSVRQVAAEYQLNPITVSRAYQELADESLVEKRRGLGMYVTEEASRKLLASERERFLPGHPGRRELEQGVPRNDHPDVVDGDRARSRARDERQGQVREDPRRGVDRHGRGHRHDPQQRRDRPDLGRRLLSDGRHRRS